MKTLQLNDITCYLPYKLKVLNNNQINTVIKVCFKTNILRIVHKEGIVSTWDEVSLTLLKPILKSMLDLNKPLENGNIPIIELAKIVFTSKNIKFSLYDNKVLVDYGDNLKYWFSTDSDFTYFHIEDCNLGVAMFPNQVKLFNYLNEYHFDYRGLIDKGLAIDINTIKE